MKSVKKVITGKKIKNYRYKKSVGGDVVESIKFYLNNDKVVRLFSPFGLVVDFKKLKKILDRKVTKMKISKNKELDTVRIEFKDGKKLKIFSTDLLFEQRNKIK